MGQAARNACACSGSSDRPWPRGWSRQSVHSGCRGRTLLLLEPPECCDAAGVAKGIEPRHNFLLGEGGEIDPVAGIGDVEITIGQDTERKIDLGADGIERLVEGFFLDGKAL